MPLKGMPQGPSFSNWFHLPKAHWTVNSWTDSFIEVLVPSWSYDLSIAHPDGGQAFNTLAFRNILYPNHSMLHHNCSLKASTHPKNKRFKNKIKKYFPHVVIYFTTNIGRKHSINWLFLWKDQLNRP
jgi:hypothetical protein